MVIYQNYFMGQNYVPHVMFYLFQTSHFYIHDPAILPCFRNRVCKNRQLTQDQNGR